MPLTYRTHLIQPSDGLPARRRRMIQTPSERRSLPFCRALRNKLGHRVTSAVCHNRTFGRTRELGAAKQTADHSFKDNSIQAPIAIQTTPAMRAIHRPMGVSFSKRTSSERTAIQRTFITPPTNKSAIRAQQQPTQ
jgi:hypothetical protein